MTCHLVPVSIAIAAMMLVTPALVSADDSSQASSVKQPTAISGGHAAIDDGWRRTTKGWEHMSSWQRPQPAPAKLSTTALVRSSKSLGRMDFHPAILAIGMIVTAVVAFLVWDPRESLEPASGK